MIFEFPSTKAIMCVQTSWNVDITQISNGHISVLLEVVVTWLGTLVLLQYMYCAYWYDLDPIQGQGQGDWPSEVPQIALFYVYLLPLYWRGTHNWLVIMIVWDVVYSFSEADFWIPPPLAVMWLRSLRNVHVTRIHCILSPHCWLRLEACDCDCR